MDHIPDRYSGYRHTFFLSRASDPEDFHKRLAFIHRRASASREDPLLAYLPEQVEISEYTNNVRHLFDTVAILKSAAKRKSLVDAVPTSLTRRESEIACLLAEGLRPRQIADKLDIRLSTVERHLAAAYAKLGVHSRAEFLRRLNGSEHYD